MSELPFGEITKSDEDLLRRVSKIAAEKNLNSTAVELGTFLGRSTVVLSEYMRIVYTIDVFEDIDLIENEASRIHYKEHFLNHPRTYQEVKESLKKYGNIYVFKSTSKDKADVIKDDSLSLLFFDADHTFEGLKKDFALWYPKLKKGGCLIVHDSGPQAHWMEPILFVKTLVGVMKQVDESELSTAWEKK